MRFNFGRFFDQFRSLQRFPLPVALAIALTILVNLEIAVLSELKPLAGEAIFALASAVVAALIVDLIAEAGSIGKLPRLIGAIAFAAAIAALQLYHGKVYDQSSVVVGALALGLMTAPYLRSEGSNESMWNFDLRLGIALAMGAVAVLVACGGLSLLLLSIQYLFDVNLPDRLYGHLWATGAALIGPLFAMAMLPVDLNERFVVSDSPASIERAVAVVLNFALAPLVLAYSLMLHVYAAKIAIMPTMPKGEIGPLVLVFGGIGTVAYMIAYPWREKGSRPVRWLLAGWFWLMIIPALLLVLAAWERIHQYGVTPQRYCLCLFALWLVAMAAYLGAMHRRIDLRAIPLSLGIAVILSSFGPWGAVAVSAQSQMRQLYVHLRAHKLLAGDRLSPSLPEMASFRKVSDHDEQLRSILAELDYLDALPRLAPLFAAVNDSPFKGASTDKELQKAFALGLQPAQPSWPPPVPLQVDIGHYNQMLGPMWIGASGINIQGPGETESAKAKIGAIELVYSGKILSAHAPGGDVTFALDTLKPQVENAPVDRQAFLLPSREGAERGAMVIMHAWPSWTNEMEAWLLLGPKSIH